MLAIASLSLPASLPVCPWVSHPPKGSGSSVQKYRLPESFRASQTSSINFTWSKYAWGLGLPVGSGGRGAQSWFGFSSCLCQAPEVVLTVLALILGVPFLRVL